VVAAVTEATTVAQLSAVVAAILLQAVAVFICGDQPVALAAHHTDVTNSATAFSESTHYCIELNRF
jgi:hypothetical protein